MLLISSNGCASLARPSKLLPTSFAPLYSRQITKGQQRSRQPSHLHRRRRRAFLHPGPRRSRRRARLSERISPTMTGAEASSGVSSFTFSETPSEGRLACPAAGNGPWQVFAYIRRANVTSEVIVLDSKSRSPLCRSFSSTVSVR